MPSRLPANYGRSSLVAGLIAAHVGVIAVATLGSPTLAVARPPAITVSEIAEVTPALPVIEPKLVSLDAHVAEPKIDVADDSASVALAAAAPGQAGTACAVGDDVQATLRTSSEVHAALDRMPRAARSVANAVLLWNGRWIDAKTVGGRAAIDPIRTAVTAVVRSATPDCRTAQLTGPRFMVVSSPSGTRILTFGSGAWTWAEVAAG